MMRRPWWLVFVGVTVMTAHWCTVSAQPAAAPNTQDEQSGYTPMAQQYLEAAKAKLSAQKGEDEEKARRAAQERAVLLSRDKLKRQTSQEQAAQRQIQQARERQLKSLYNNAVAQYERGAYEEAIRTLQQLIVTAPGHSLAKSAERLVSRAELKLFEHRLRASAESPQTSGASVAELEQKLRQKRMEIETAIKYARAAVEESKHDAALKLLTAILVQDPDNKEAQDLVQQVQLAKLDEERDKALDHVERNERAMINDVIKAQVLPQNQTAPRHAAQLVAVDPKSMIAAKLQQPISFAFEDVALSDVLQFLGESANVSIIPSPQLDLKTRRVSLKVNELSLEQAIKYLAKSLSLSYRIERDAILIATAEEFSNEPMETRVFFLQNGIGPFALETAAIEPNPALVMMESVTKLIEQSTPAPSGSKFIVDERTGALVVTNTAENLRFVERMLSQLDITPIQVLIEARFVELTMTDLEHQAFETVLTKAADITHKAVDDHTFGPGHQIASGGGFKFPALTRESEGLNLTLEGVLTNVQFESVLHLLEESQKSKTLSAPRVTTLNNQTALIRVVEEFNYPTRYEVSLIQFDINGDGDFDDAGETEFANVPQDMQKRDIGILLNVTPSVGKDMKTITLVVAPEVSQFSEFRDLGGGVTVPTFTSSQLTTSVVIDNGQTVVLGGLMTDSDTDQVTKVPVLGDLPLVGALFRQKEKTSSKTNLLIFITARLLGPKGQTT